MSSPNEPAQPKMIVEPWPDHPEAMQERDPVTGRVGKWYLSDAEIARRFPALARATASRPLP